MLSKFNNKKHRRLTALLLCVALMLGSVTSVSADISAADSETEAQSGVQTYAEESTAEALSYEAPETEAQAVETEAHTEAATEANTETATEAQTEAHTEAAQAETTGESAEAEVVAEGEENVWTAQVGNRKARWLQYAAYWALFY